MHCVIRTRASQTLGSITSNSCKDAIAASRDVGAIEDPSAEDSEEEVDPFLRWLEDDHDSVEVLETVSSSCFALEFGLGAGVMPNDLCIAACAYSESEKKRLARKGPRDSCVRRMLGIWIVVELSWVDWRYESTSLRSVV